MPGPPPKPTALKILGGNAGKRPLNKREPKPRRVMPRRPRMNRRAGALWDRLAPMLFDMGVLTELDSTALMVLCTTGGDLIECSELLRKNGRTYEGKTPSGSTIVRPRPEVAIVAMLRKELRAWLLEFGLTPASRSRIEVAPLPVEDPLAKYVGNSRKSSDPTADLLFGRKRTP